MDLRNPSRGGQQMTKLLTVLLLCGVAAFAQQTGISGRVTDPSGAFLVTAHVTASGEDGSRFTTVTTNEGRYQFPAVRATTYLLRFEAPGFAPAERTLTLLVGQSPDVDIQMQLATTSS